MNVSQIPLWGRAWKLTVKTQSGNQLIISQSAWDPESLRIVFDVLQTVLPSPFWFALIKIYNLNDATKQNLLWNAQWATLEAGFQTGPTQSTIIWDGPVLQVLYDRENVTDFTMTLNCMAGPTILENEFVNWSRGPGYSQLQTISDMIAHTSGQAFGSVSQQQLNTQLSPEAQAAMQAKSYPRGKTFFGSSTKYFGQIADDNLLTHWKTGITDYMSELFNPKVNRVPNFIYGPPLAPGYVPSSSPSNITRSILGVPRQSTFNVIFTVLLDPRLIVKVPPILVQLDKTVISQQKITVGQLPAILDRNNIYVAGQVHHYGDSRGNDWSTEVTGFTQNYAQIIQTISGAGR